MPEEIKLTKEQLDIMINEEYIWLEKQRTKLSEESSKISDTFDWTLFDFHLYNVKISIGKLQLLKKLKEQTIQ